MSRRDIDVLVMQGRQALAAGAFAEARERYQAILRLDSAQPRAWLALSAIAQRNGDFRDSVRTARSAVPSWKQSGSQQFITELSMRLLVLGEYKEARDLISSADWSDPIVLRYSMGLVQYLGLAEAHQEALELADHAISRIGNAPSTLLFARANALRYLGRMQEATEAYERCIAMDPLHAEAHWSLAHHAPSIPSGARVPRIRKAISHTQSSSEEAIYLQYALFKELDDAGDSLEAWRVLEAVSRSKRRLVRYADSEGELTYRTLMEVCDADFLARGRGRESAQATGFNPIFIVGLPRSGTTVLERMLGNHPRITLAGELNDFQLQMSWEANRFIGEFPDAGVLRSMLDVDFASLGKNYLKRTAWRLQEGASHLVDKLPNNILHAGFIRRALPDAKLVCLRRNMMDSCFSTFKHLFSGAAYPYSYDLTEMAGHYQRFARLAAHWQSLMPENFMIVDYDDLVEHPGDVLARVAQFCDLPFQHDMADIERNRAPSATASSSQVREGVHTRNIGSWRRYENQLAGLLEYSPG